MTDQDLLAMLKVERYPHLKVTDPEVYDLIYRQAAYEGSTLKMIASENYASFSVLEATGSSLTNKYCEGYPGARYYEGNAVCDEIENLAKRVLEPFPFVKAERTFAAVRFRLSVRHSTMMAMPLGP